jgi:hypothetical protein
MEREPGPTQPSGHPDIALNNAATPEFPYQLRELAGEGAMGLVFRADEPDLQR